MNTATFLFGGLGLFILTACTTYYATVKFKADGGSRGAFLETRNEDLANAYEQVVAQLHNERDEWAKQMKEFEAKLNRLQGELDAHRLQYAEVIAKEVVSALRKAGRWSDDHV